MKKPMKYTTRLLLCLLSAAALAAGWLSLSGVPLLAALVPLLLISESYDTGRRNFWRMFGWVALAFTIWNQSTTWWIINTFINSEATAAGVAVSVLNVGITLVLFGGMFMLYHWVSKRAPRALAYTIFVAGWIACEYLYMVGELSFPWLTLGNGFANDIKLVQWYDTTGVFGGSLWILICNLLTFDIIRRGKQHSPRAWIAPALFILVPMAISLVKYYNYEEKGGRELTVTVVQPNIDPHFEKFLMSQDRQTDILLGEATKAPADADFILMPETAIDESITEGELSNSGILEQFREFLREGHPASQIITGATTYRFYGRESGSTTARRNRYGLWFDVYNTALALDTTRTVQVYHKSMLLVGVERTPFYDLLNSQSILTIDMGGITGQLGYDTEPSAFVHSADTVAAPICWEGVFGAFCGGFVQKGAQALFIISNDGWWNDTQGHRQLFLFARLRAVEHRRSVARSANTGVSGFIDQRGAIIDRLGWDERGALTDTIRTNSELTFYTRYGDYIARQCGYVFGLCLLYLAAYLIRRRNKLVQ